LWKAAIAVSAPDDVSSDRTAERQWICARRIRKRRRQLDLTQADLADLLTRRGVLLTNRTVSAMENGRRLDLGKLPDLAAALTCSVTYLLGMTRDPSRWEPDDWQPITG
jgi:transcriptional regulator with XRE-family HTH domain